jgi:probable phosphoglycerate mutase
MNHDDQSTTSTSTIYLMRHGDIHRDDVRRYIGQADIELNANGRSQAITWRREMSRIPLKRIYCSDLSRSHETACIIAEGRNAPVQSLPKLREINLGAWDGLEMAEVQSLYPAEYEKRGADMVYYRPPAGECFADVAARVIPLFEEIVRNATGNHLIVGHAGANRVILSHILGMPLENIFRLPQEYGCLNIVDCSRERTRLVEINLDCRSARRVIRKRDVEAPSVSPLFLPSGTSPPVQEMALGIYCETINVRKF